MPKKNLALFAAANLADVFGAIDSCNDDAAGMTQHKNVAKSTKNLVVNSLRKCTKPCFLVVNEW